MALPGLVVNDAGVFPVFSTVDAVDLSVNPDLLSVGKIEQDRRIAS